LLPGMVPRIAPSPCQSMLRLPSPLLGTPTEGMLAYRLEGMEAVPSPQNLSVATVRAELFRETWTKLAQRDAPVVTGAASFRRTAAASALGLAVQAVRPVANVESHWTVGPLRADLTANIELNEAAQD